MRFDFASLHATKKKRAMNNGKTIFSQILSNIQEREFKVCVDRYKALLGRERPYKSTGMV